MHESQIEGQSPSIQGISSADTVIEYQPLPEVDPYSQMYDFLKSIGITRDDLGHLKISEDCLLKLFTQEMGLFAGWKWSRFDHAAENLLQWLLLAPTDVGPEAKESCYSRVRPQERSILLKSTCGLIKAHSVRGFIKGIETGFFRSVRYFIYGVLLYRFVNGLQTGVMRFDELGQAFSHSDQKGIHNLVQALAKIEIPWLKLILTAPLILGSIQSLWSIRQVKTLHSNELARINDRITQYLENSGGIWRDIVCEIFPFSSLSNRMQRLEDVICWDGRLSIEDRKKAFEDIRRGRAGFKLTQLNILECLAKIAQAIGFKDLLRLRQAGYSVEELKLILYMKASALEDLEKLSQLDLADEEKLSSMSSIPRRLYANYLLWWLGQSTSFWKQQLPFSVFSSVKLATELFFLVKIIMSFVSAIKCQYKPPFKFNNNVQDWASKDTAECCARLIDFFRTLDVNESVDVLVAQITQYNLKNMTSLILSDKNLNYDEALQIIRAVLKQGAVLQQLNLTSNQLKYLSSEMFLNLTQLQVLSLSNNPLISLSDNLFISLSNLLELYINEALLTNVTEKSFAGLSRLQTLELAANQLMILVDWVFSDLVNLRVLNLKSNQLNNLGDKVLSGLNLDYLDLSFNRLNNLTDEVFSDLRAMKVLNLRRNTLVRLSDKVFFNLDELEELDLSSNKNLTGVLSNQLFVNQGYLKYLNLQAIGLSILNMELFSYFNHLEYLDLSNNEINSTTLIEALPFLPTTLISLKISSNNLTYLPEDFSQQLPDLITELHIGGNSFIPTVLTLEFMHYFPARLTIFGIEGGVCNITQNAFSYFSLLESLDLSYNQLEHLDNGTFDGLPQLKNLNLKYNRLSSLGDRVFDNLPQLETLYLTNNELSSLSDLIFSSSYGLKFLYLDHNKLIYLNERLLANLSNLSTLQLAYNELNDLDRRAFSSLIRLQELALNNNRLTDLEVRLLSNLTQLQSLWLSNNQLGNVAVYNMTINFLYQLGYLYLSNNTISNIQPLTEIVSCTNLTAVDISGNPINDTGLYLEIQKNSLKQVCDDQLCHANLPATRACEVSQDQEDDLFTVKGQMLNHSYGFFNSSSFSNSNSLSLPTSNLSPNSTDSILTPAVAGAMIVSVVGFGLLLYKNLRIVQTAVNAGFQLLQRTAKSLGDTHNSRIGTSSSALFYVKAEHNVAGISGLSSHANSL